MACVVLRQGIAPGMETAVSIQDWCLQRLAYFKAPGHVAFLDVLPLTATSKVQKASLAKLDLAGAPAFDLRERKRRDPIKA
jgi:acyl-coenzyme A synthetase/AMP-(fatty) acid ligase